MAKFSRYEPVTVVDRASPFYNWAGTVELKSTTAEDTYTVKCSFMGWGGGNVLWLTFRANQLALGLPAQDRQETP